MNLAVHIRRPEGPGHFTAAGFHVPRDYLVLLLGSVVATRLLAKSGAHGSGRPDCDEFIPSTVFLKLCLEQMRITDDESFGISAKPIPKGTLGILMAAAGQGNNLGEALKRFAAAAVLLRPDIKVAVRRNRRGLSIALSYEGKRTARMELFVETFALTIHCAFRWLTGRRLRPLQAILAEPIGRFRKTMLKSVLRCPTIVKGSGATLSYRASDAAAPLAPVKYNTWAAHEFVEFMRLLEEAAADRNSRTTEGAPAIVRDVREAIYGGLHGETAVARHLRMSSATLRRRLADAGSSFRALLDDVQRGTAATLLMTDKSFEEIAAEIGYSDARSFRRAGQRWFGMTPSAYRRGQAPRHKRPV